MANNGVWRVHSLIAPGRDFLSGCNLWMFLKGAKMGNLTFGSSILSSPVTLFADTFGLPSSSGSTMIFSCNSMVRGWFNIYSDRGKNARSWINPHRFLEHFSFPWSFPIPALTKPGCFASKIRQDLGWRWEDCWEMLSAALRHLTRSGAGCAKPPKNAAAFGSVGM